MTHSYLIYLEKSLPRCPPCLPLSSAQGDLHKRHLSLTVWKKEKKRQKKGRAPRWATFRWGLALKSSRTTENEASLTRCPCCQRVLMHKEGHLHTSIIFHDISRLKIIRIRSFASNLNLTWGENSWKHSFTFGNSCWKSSAVPTERRHAAHQTTTLNKDVWESMLEIGNRFSKMRWLRFINHLIINSHYTGYILLIPFSRTPFTKPAPALKDRHLAREEKHTKADWADGWCFLHFCCHAPRAWTVFFVFLGGVSSKAALLSTSFPHLFGHFPKPFSYAACFTSLLKVLNIKIWELSVQRHAKGSAAGSWHKRLAGLSMKSKQYMVQSRPMCLVETQ